jgi:hypothetical protein
MNIIQNQIGNDTDKFPNILTLKNIVIEKMWFVVDVDNEFINQVIEIIDIINEECTKSIEYKNKIMLLATLILFIAPFMKLDIDTSILNILKKINFVILKNDLKELLSDIKLNKCYENFDKIVKFIPTTRIRIEI